MVHLAISVLQPSAAVVTEYCIPRKFTATLQLKIVAAIPHCINRNIHIVKV